MGQGIRFVFIAEKDHVLGLKKKRRLGVSAPLQVAKERTEHEAK
jgi:hypothetical protein